LWDHCAIGRRSGGMSDWRVDLAQHTKGATLTLKKYVHTGEKWEHVHCEICSEEFSETAPKALREGYTTPDNGYWICPDCFSELKEQMGWKLV
jgi:hypothetical protein